MTSEHIHLIGITGSDSPLNTHCDVSLVVETLENTSILTPMMSRIGALVVIDILSTAVALRRDAAHHARFLPVRAVMQTSLNSVGKIPLYTGPLLQVHGDADRVVPYRLGVRLHAAAAGPKEFVTVPGGGHNRLYTPAYVAALDRFRAGLR